MDQADAGGLFPFQAQSSDVVKKKKSWSLPLNPLGLFRSPDFFSCLCNRIGCFQLAFHTPTMSNAQLNSIGAMDSFLQNTYGYSFWSSEYVQHAPFSFDFRYTDISSCKLGEERTVAIERDHDLSGRVYFTCTLATLSDVANAYYVEDVGHAMLEWVKFSCSGNSEVSVLYPEAEHAYEQLSVPREKRLGAVRGACESVLELIQRAQAAQKIWVRLRFWFGEDYGLFLPYVAMYLSPVSLKLKLRALTEITVGYTGGTLTNTTAISNAQIAMECVYLDDPERAHFTKSSLRYLMCQTQKFERLDFLNASSQGTTTTDKLSFNHPVLEKMVLFRKSTNRLASTAGFTSYFNFNGPQTGQYVDEAFNTITEKINGNKRWELLDPLQMRAIIPQHYHSSIPQKRVYVLPYSINPEDFSHPAGSLNHSRLDNLVLEVVPQALNNSSNPIDLMIFARNLNIGEIALGVFRVLFAS